MKVAIPLFIAFSSFELTYRYKPDEELITAGIQATGLGASE
jgi:hypothetical protein